MIENEIENKILKLEMLNKKYLISELIKQMTIIGLKKDMSGEDKKKWVLLRIKEELDLPDIVEDIIIALIDYIILIDKGQIKINPVVKKNFFKCC